MSTVPGDDAMRDAGLLSPDLDDSIDLAEEVERSGVAGDDGTGESVEDYDPGTPRPDRVGAADEADVLDQARVVPVLEDDDGE